MTVQIALCDDETTELNKTEKILSAYEQKHTNADFMIERFENTDKLLYTVRNKIYLPDIVFMDIYIPGRNGKTLPLGMEAARLLRDMGNRSKLVFLTTSREHALDAFDVEAFQYLLKPLQEKRLFSLLDRILTEGKWEREKCLLLRVDGILKKIPINDIVFCEARGKQQHIYMANGTEVVQNLTMTRIYEMCSACPGLVRAGASYIIHLEHIDSLNAQEAQMDNGQKIYLPRGAYRSLREQYFDYYCGKE